MGEFSMRKTITAALAAASMLALAGCKQTTTGGNEATENAAVPAAAATSVDGTWIADIDSVQFDQKPDEYLLQGGQYSCKSCVPSYTVAADGAFHPVSLPYADSMAVKVVDDHTILRTAKKGNRQTGENKVTVSADGNTLTGNFTDSSVEKAPPTKGEYTETRVGAAPAGAHAVSGQWKPGKLANFNPEALTVTLKVEGDTFHFSSPSGYSYDAKLGGPDVPIKGDIAGTTASVNKLDDGSYQETDKRGGKVVGLTTFTAGSDGKLHVVGEDKTNGSKTTWTATKQ
jgi:hypothetical protein